jgi:tetratricopeptide (TPR) repeat protein
VVKKNPNVLSHGAYDLEQGAVASYSGVGTVYPPELIYGLKSIQEPNPESPEALSELGMRLALEGHVGDALKKYREALERKSDSPEILTSFGTVLAKNGQLHEAIVSYRKALQLAPGFLIASYNLGAVLTRKRGNSMKQSNTMERHWRDCVSAVILCLGFHPLLLATCADFSNGAKSRSRGEPHGIEA